MELRIYRTFKWVYDRSQEVRMGGPPPRMILEQKDTLQWSEDGENWKDIPIIEADKPVPPWVEKQKNEKSEFKKSVKDFLATHLESKKNAG